MRLLVSLLSLTAVVLAIALLATPTRAQDGADAQALFLETHKCNVCHSVAAADIEHKSEKTAGPDLGGYTTDDREALARFLRKEEEREGENHKKTFAGTDEELTAILDWLASLEPAAE
jgi:mono/diheme cytochrome c family protein